VVGVLLVLAGVGAGVAAAGVLADPGALVDAGVDDVAVTHRPLLATAGAAVTALAGTVVTARGRRWAALSRRYETPATRDQAAVDDPAPATAPGPELWDALDRGEDPTRG
jgi:uncharacterized membrane protein (TIGR02234 family)